MSSENGGSKYQWYVDCLDLISKSDLIVGINTFELEDDTTNFNIDWRVNTTKESLNGFIEGLNNPAYR
jgi:hypothetical protein